LAIVRRQLDSDELVIIGRFAVDLAGAVVDVLCDILRKRVAGVA
jgi:hypothetical protein